MTEIDYEKREDGVHLIRLGSKYGGYWIPDKMDYSIIYDCGVGEDTSFAECCFIKFWRSDIHLFDPTAKAIKHLESISKCYSHRWFPHYLGVSDINEIKKFYPPKNPEHASFSAENIQHTDNPVNFQCYSLKTIMDILNHEYIDLLKLDIEGSEYAVISSLRNFNIKPKVIVVEFHALDHAGSLIKYAADWLEKNYVLLKTEDNNYTYLEKKEYDRRCISHQGQKLGASISLTTT